MPPTTEQVVEWLVKAERDLMSAEILLDHEPLVLDTACFHCQQAAEKALKAFLVWQTVWAFVPSLLPIEFRPRKTQVKGRET
jgi:HEPN domain-containing protein